MQSVLRLGSARPTAPSAEVLSVSITNCATKAGGVGIDLNAQNIILEIRPETAASRALEAGTGLRVGDRILSVDGAALNGRILTEVIQSADQHDFEVERLQGWAGFSIDETEVDEEEKDDDGFATLSRLRDVVVVKQDGQLGIHPEVHCPDADTAIIKVAKVCQHTQAAACGVVSVGDTIRSINGQPLACAADENPLTAAMKVLEESRDGENITLELESDALKAGWMQKKGDKTLFKAMSSWQRRFFVLVWSDSSLAEREIRYYEGQDYCSRKQKGAIDLSRATEVKQVEIEGGAGLAVETPGRVWELLPPNRDEAVEWYRLLNQLFARKRGLAVVASLSAAGSSGLDLEDEATKVAGQLTVVLQRKLGMSINKLGNEIVVAELEPDGAAAACGLLSVGDALDEVNGAKTESCRQTIKLLMANPSCAQLKLFSKVVHGGWMHKLGEGLGGWTTRYFTLTYELDPTSQPRTAQGAGGNTAKVTEKLDAKRERPRAASIAAGASSSVLVHLHKASRTDKLGLSLAEDADGRVVIHRIYDGYVASKSAALRAGDVLFAINGKPAETQPTAHRHLTEATGSIELSVQRQTDSGCWMLRYYDAKNSVSRSEKGSIRLAKGTVREINKYTLQDESGAAAQDGVPRVGLYILQDERCWELLPPEEELDMWIAKLQLAVFGQEVVAAEYQSAEREAEAAAKVKDLKGAHYLTLQQQYGLMLATYKDAPSGGAIGAAPTPPPGPPPPLPPSGPDGDCDSGGGDEDEGGGGDEDEGGVGGDAGGAGAVARASSSATARASAASAKARASTAMHASGRASQATHTQAVYIMSMEMDGAGACSGLLHPDDRILKVGGVFASSLAQVTAVFRESRDTVKLTVASNVVWGGYLQKKGELNSALQLRWFLLSDEGDASVLRYFDGRNAVSRTQKGAITISPHEVQSVRHFTWERGGERALALRIVTPSRVFELVSKRNDDEVRRLTELLNTRIRRRLARPSMAAATEVRVRVRRASRPGAYPHTLSARLTTPPSPPSDHGNAICSRYRAASDWRDTREHEALTARRAHV